MGNAMRETGSRWESLDAAGSGLTATVGFMSRTRYHRRVRVVETC
jgi:hypothetical protein